MVEPRIDGFRHAADEIVVEQQGPKRIVHRLAPRPRPERVRRGPISRSQHKFFETHWVQLQQLHLADGKRIEQADVRPGRANKGPGQPLGEIFQRVHGPLTFAHFIENDQVGFRVDRNSAQYLDIADDSIRIQTILEDTGKAGFGEKVELVHRRKMFGPQPLHKPGLADLSGTVHQNRFPSRAVFPAQQLIRGQPFHSPIPARCFGGIIRPIHYLYTFMLIKVRENRTFRLIKMQYATLFARYFGESMVLLFRREAPGKSIRIAARRPLC